MQYNNTNTARYSDAVTCELNLSAIISDIAHLQGMEISFPHLPPYKCFMKYFYM
jgi:hypothetical protein